MSAFVQPVISRSPDTEPADWSPATTPDAGCRLLWAPAGAAGQLAGAWWPRTGDAESELREFLPLAGAQLGGPIVRVSLNMQAWGDKQPRRIWLDGRLVRLGWFRTINPAIVTIARTEQARHMLLVISASLPEVTGHDIMARLAGTSGWPDSVPAALDGPQPG